MEIIGRWTIYEGGNVVKLDEITQNIKDEWADAYNPSGFRHGVNEAPIYLYRELANGLVSVLARALKAEFHLRCFQFNNAPNDHADHYDEMEKHIWTDADWIAEAERILRGVND